MGEPAAHHAVSGLGVGHRQPGIAAVVVIRGSEAAGSQGLPVPGRRPTGRSGQIHTDGNQRHSVEQLGLASPIDQFRLKLSKWRVWGNDDLVLSAVGISHLDRLEQPGRHHPGCAVAPGKAAAGNERLLRADAGDGELPLARIESDL